MDDEAQDENEPQYFGDIDLYATEVVVETGAGQPSARIHDELLPGLIDPESVDPWRLYADPNSGRYPWQGLMSSPDDEGCSH